MKQIMEPSEWVAKLGARSGEIGQRYQGLRPGSGIKWCYANQLGSVEGQASAGVRRDPRHRAGSAASDGIPHRCALHLACAQPLLGL